MLLPILIWPFIEPNSANHCEALIEFFSTLKDDRVAIPTIVVHQRARRWLRNQHLRNFEIMEKLHWNVRWVWSVETCQTWLDALATSHTNCNRYNHSIRQRALKKPTPHESRCVHLLVPADFRYADPAGIPALRQMVQQVDVMADPRIDLSVGQIQSGTNDFKELVDTQGTWKLLKLWFPEESTILARKRITKPRSEFLALSGRFLESQLEERWLPYSQTLIMLLRSLHKGATEAINVFELGPLTEDAPQDPYAEYVTQVEREERVLKLYWREHMGKSTLWAEQYQTLAQKSQKLVSDLLAQSRSLFLKSH